MHIISLNLNDIRSVASKGFSLGCWRKKPMSPDMLVPCDHHSYFHYAAKTGYSGVYIYAKRKPDALTEAQ